MSISDYKPSKSEKDAFVKEVERAVRHAVIATNRMTVSTANDTLRRALIDVVNNPKFKDRPNDRKNAFQDIQKALIAQNNAQQKVEQRTKAASQTSKEISLWTMFNPYKWQSALDDLTSEKRQGWASNTARRLTGGFSFEERMNEKYFSPETMDVIQKGLSIAEDLQESNKKDDSADEKTTNEKTTNETTQTVQLTNGQQPLSVDFQPVTQRLDQVDKTISDSNSRIVDTITHFMAPQTKKPQYNLEQAREQVAYQNQIQATFEALGDNTEQIVDILAKTAAAKPVATAATTNATSQASGGSLLGGAIGTVLTAGLATKLGGVLGKVGKVLTTGVKSIPLVAKAALQGVKVLTTNPKLATEIAKNATKDKARTAVSATKDKLADALSGTKLEKVLTSERAITAREKAAEFAKATKDKTLQAVKHVQTHGVKNSLADVIEATQKQSDQLLKNVKNGADKILTNENVVTAKNKITAATQPIFDKINTNDTFNKAKDAYSTVTQHATADQVKDSLRNSTFKDTAKLIGKFPLAKVAGGLSVLMSAGEAVSQYNDQSDLIEKKLKAGILTEDQASDAKAKAGAEIATSNAIIGGGTALFGALGSIAGPVGAMAGAAVGNYLSEGLVNSSLGQFIIKGIGDGVVALKDLFEDDKDTESEDDKDTESKSNFDDTFIPKAERGTKQDLEELVDEKFAQDVGYNPQALEDFAKLVEEKTRQKPRNWNSFTREQQEGWYAVNKAFARHEIIENYRDKQYDRVNENVKDPSQYQIDEGYLDYALKDKKYNEKAKALIQQHKEELGKLSDYNPQVMAAYNRRVDAMMQYAPSRFYQADDASKYEWLEERLGTIKSDVNSRRRKGLYDTKNHPPQESDDLVDYYGKPAATLAADAALKEALLKKQHEEALQVAKNNDGIVPSKDSHTGETLNKVATKQANEEQKVNNTNNVSSINNVNNNSSVTYAGMSATDNRGYKDMLQETRTVPVS